MVVRAASPLCVSWPALVFLSAVSAGVASLVHARVFPLLLPLLSVSQAAKELVPGARDGGAAVNAVGQTAVLTLKGASALNR